MATLTKNDLVKLIAEIARREIKKEINIYMCLCSLIFHGFQ